jgi:hypothetical protein
MPNRVKLTVAMPMRSRGFEGGMLCVGSTQLLDGGDEGGYLDGRFEGGWLDMVLSVDRLPLPAANALRRQASIRRARLVHRQREQALPAAAKPDVPFALGQRAIGGLQTQTAREVRTCEHT